MGARGYLSERAKTGRVPMQTVSPHVASWPLMRTEHVVPMPTLHAAVTPIGALRLTIVPTTTGLPLVGIAMLFSIQQWISMRQCRLMISHLPDNLLRLYEGEEFLRQKALELEHFPI